MHILPLFQHGIPEDKTDFAFQHRHSCVRTHTQRYAPTCKSWEDAGLNFIPIPEQSVSVYTWRTDLGKILEIILSAPQF